MTRGDLDDLRANRGRHRPLELRRHQRVGGGQDVGAAAGCGQIAVPLLAQRGDALRALRPLEVRPDRVALGRISRRDVLVDVQGTAPGAGADDQPAECGDARILVAVGERIAANEESSTDAPGRGIQAATYTTGSSGCSTAILAAVKPPNE